MKEEPTSTGSIIQDAKILLANATQEISDDVVQKLQAFIEQVKTGVKDVSSRIQDGGRTPGMA